MILNRPNQFARNRSILKLFSRGKSNRPRYKRRCKFEYTDRVMAVFMCQCHLERSIAVDTTYSFNDYDPVRLFCSAQSNFVNKSRLKVLQTRQAHLEELFNETRNKLQETSVDKDKYTKLLKDLILEVYTSLVFQLLCDNHVILNNRIAIQGLYALLDESVSLIVRKSDIDLVQSVIPQVSETYRKATKQKVSITIESDHHVPTSR